MYSHHGIRRLGTFPVRASTNGRYLVEARGTPFPILGRTAWFLTSLSTSNYQSFIDNTVSHGYNAVEFHVVNHDSRGNNPPFNGNSDLPFTNKLNGTSWAGALTYGNINNEAPDFTTPNETYWTHVDGILSYAESKRVLCLIFPAYVGYDDTDQGWWAEMVANGTTRMQTYGAWIATRYRAQKNLVWMMGGDQGTNEFSAAELNAEVALFNGVNGVVKSSTLYSAEWATGEISTDETTLGSSMTFNGAYDWDGDVNTQGRRAYSYGGSTRPSFLLEEPYDEEGPDGNDANPSATQPTRRFIWWGWLSTIGGYVAGNGYVWLFTSGYTTHLNTTQTQHLAILNAFIRSIPWYTLVPSELGGMIDLITAGSGGVSTNTYVAASANATGTLLVAYRPPDHTGSFTVAMTAMSGTCRARWFDPTNGTYSSIGNFSNSGTQAFTPSGNNSAGQADWVLVLDIP